MTSEDDSSNTALSLTPLGSNLPFQWTTVRVGTSLTYRGRIKLRDIRLRLPMYVVGRASGENPTVAHSGTFTEGMHSLDEAAARAVKGKTSAAAEVTASNTRRFITSPRFD